MKAYLTAALKIISLGIFPLMGLLMDSACALTFPLPETGDVVGEMQTTTVRQGESLADIGRRFDVGIYEMLEANPKLDPWLPPAGAIVTIPTQYILPSAARTGMVLNLAEMRLYYFHPDKRLVTTFPVGLGKKNWSTPLGKTTITRKQKDPAWHPPASIRKEHLENGDVLPLVVAGGTPENPLGRYALYLNTSGLADRGSFLIHGSNRPGGVGVRSSHGCIRLFPEDIESLYYLVPTGTAVRIVHEPHKIGWHNRHLYLESHQPLTETQYVGSDSLMRLTTLIDAATNNAHAVDWLNVKMTAKTANGYPVRID